MSEAQRVVDIILATRIIGIVRAHSPREALEDARALASVGLRAVEVSLVTPGAVDAIAELTASDVTVGVGTALDPAEVHAAADAGARFVVSPNTDERVIDATLSRGLVSIPGAGSVSEAVRARQAGAHLVKLFPATVFGPQSVSAILASLPDLPLVPTGGVGLGDITTYLAAGAKALGMGGALVRSARGDPVALRRMLASSLLSGDSSEVVS